MANALSENRPLIVLTGPTAVGKTALSILLAKKIGGEIISADSMQVYKRMDIGTAKIKREEMQGVPHHLIDILEPTEDFNVVIFSKLAKQLIQEIRDRGNIPILVGGTGFYIQAVLYDIDFTDTDENTGLREELTAFAQKYGTVALHNRLKELDPEAAEVIHENDLKRIIRGIEFATQTGGKISEHNKEMRDKKSAYNSAYFVLDMDRAVLYRRIEQRIDEMLEEGLLNEVEELRREGVTKECVSMQGLGYKEFFDYLDGKQSLADAVAVLKRDTRHFAKRQITWFKREKDVIFLSKDETTKTEDLLEKIMEVLKEKGIVS